MSFPVYGCVVAESHERQMALGAFLKRDILKLPRFVVIVLSVLLIPHAVVAPLTPSTSDDIITMLERLALTTVIHVQPVHWCARPLELTHQRTKRLAVVGVGILAAFAVLLELDVERHPIHAYHLDMRHLVDEYIQQAVWVLYEPVHLHHDAVVGWTEEGYLPVSPPRIPLGHAPSRGRIHPAGGLGSLRTSPPSSRCCCRLD